MENTINEVECMSNKVSVVFAIFEASPFISTGGLGDIGGTLPAEIKKRGCDVKVIMPKFRSIPEKYRNEMEPVATFQVPLSWRSQYCGIEKLEHNGVTYYFVDNEYYFYRDRLYAYLDDAERIAYFCKAVLESLQYVPELACDILHCNDWHTALIPVFLREFYCGMPRYDHIKTVFTIHNLKFQGIFSKDILGDILGIDYIPAAVNQLEFDNAVNFMKGAICYSDVLTTVSPNYAREIHYAYYGENLDGMFREKHGKLHGILNGINNDEYNPKTDSYIIANYSAKDFADKRKNKKALQEKLGLLVEPDVPLIIMISRLTEQKGIDIFLHILEELLNEDVAVAVLGTGDECYEHAFRDIESRHKGRMSATITFNQQLSHQFYAGGDLLVMPSRYEPCGLSQMIAMRYGTLPVVRETGGLKDSVTPYNKYTGDGNGFSFTNYNAQDLLNTLRFATDIYRNEPEHWRKIIKQAMEADFSWDRSAKEYVDIYQSL